jgi:hypothetical protein
MIVAVQTSIRMRGLGTLDVFRAFDHNRDGLLSCSELYGGLEWLGLRVQPADIHALMQHVDKSNEGRMRFLDFDSSFADPDDEDEVSAQQKPNISPIDLSAVTILPKKMEELFKAPEKRALDEKIEIDLKALQDIKVKCQPIDQWQCMWTSKGTGSRQEVSIWSPLAEGKLLKRNKYRLTLGFYCVKGHGKPHKNKPPKELKVQAVELTDMQTSTLMK